jgi:hypothetical protein
MMQTQTGYEMWFLILGPVTLLMVLGVIAVFIALLWHERTRSFGLALLGVFGVIGLLFFGMAFSYSTVERVPAQETVVHTFDGSHSSYLVPEIELEQAAKDMHATASIAEVVEKLNNGESDSSVGGATGTEGEPSESPKVAAKQESDLPAWVTAIPSTVGGVHRQVVNSGPWSEVSDCQKKLNESIRAAVEDRVKVIASEDLQQIVNGIPYLEFLGISQNWIDQNIVCSHPEPFSQTSDTSVGPMKTVYKQLEFDPNDQEFLRQRYRDYVRRDRIEMVAGGGFFLLGCIGLVFGLLKIDTWTKGYYTKRLFLGVPAAIIGVFILSSLLGF